MSETDRRRKRLFPDAGADLDHLRHIPETPQTRSPTYRLAFADPDFMLRDELRPVRLQLELMKPELILAEEGVESTVVIFGGARILPPEDRHAARTPLHARLSRYYEEARDFAYRVTLRSLETGGRELVVTTGGGPGAMEAGNRGAAEAGGRSVGLGIVLPHEQAPNLYVTPELSFNFHYFAIRKMHFLMRAKCIAVFPGGFGTLDELFETLTLIQTGRMNRIPIFLFGREFWDQVVDFGKLAEAGTISPEDLALFRFVETGREAAEALFAWIEKEGDIPTLHEP